MEQKAKGVRSYSWFYGLLIRGVTVRPPKSDEFGKFAELLGTSAHHVGIMVAEEFHDLKTRQVSQRVLRFESILNALTEDQAESLEKFLKLVAVDQNDRPESLELHGSDLRGGVAS